MKLVKEKIVLPDSYSITSGAEESRNALVLKAQELAAITSVESQSQAADICRDIRQHLKTVENTRKELTAPLLEGQRLLMALSNDHTQPLKDELARIEGLATTFQLSEQQRVKAEEDARQAEIARLNKERLEAIAASQPVIAPAGAVDDEEAYNASRQAAAEADALAVQQRAVIVAPMPVVQKARGQQLRKVLRYEVLDIRAVYAARPELCGLEIKPSAVLATCDPAMQVPGLRLWWEEKATFTTR